MKKTIYITLAVVFMAGMTACKKDYTCCIHVPDPEAPATGSINQCEDRTGLKKSEVDDLYTAGYTCTEK